MPMSTPRRKWSHRNYVTAKVIHSKRAIPMILHHFTCIFALLSRGDRVSIGYPAFILERHEKQTSIRYALFNGAGAN
jgi:hypothetical protein